MGPQAEGAETVAIGGTERPEVLGWDGDEGRGQSSTAGDMGSLLSRPLKLSVLNQGPLAGGACPFTCPWALEQVKRLGNGEMCVMPP